MVRLSSTFLLSLFNLTNALGYGQTGPFREAAGYDVIIEAEAGLMHMYGIPVVSS